MKDHLGGATSSGVILSSFGVGTLLGGLLALHWRPRRPLLSGVAGTIAFVPMPAMLALSSPVAAIAAVAFAAGVGFATFDTQWSTTMQRQIPPEVLSKVSAYDWLGSLALLPVGFLIAGPIAAAIGIHAALYGASAFAALMVVVLLSIPEVRQLTNADPKIAGTPQGPDGAAVLADTK